MNLTTRLRAVHRAQFRTRYGAARSEGLRNAIHTLGRGTPGLLATLFNPRAARIDLRDEKASRVRSNSDRILRDVLTLPGLLRYLRGGNRPYVLSLVLLNLFYFGDALFTGSTFFYRDIGNFHQPLRRLVTEAYSQGEWPLWNPYVQFGQPLLANPNAMALYPTQILFHLFPFDFAFDLNLVLHCLVGGLGAFYLARALGLSPMAALAAGIAYNFNGVILSLVNVPLLAAIGGLLPWLALLLRRVVRSPSPANLAPFSILWGLLLLLLEPLTTYAAFLFLAPFGVYSFWGRPAGVPSRRVVLGLLIAVVAGSSLAAVQILPTLELLQNSGRGGGLPFSSVSSWSFHPITLSQMLFPHVWKDAFDLTGAQSSWAFAFLATREAYLVSCYAGLGCLLLALVGLFFSDQRGLKWLLLCASAVALILAVGAYTPVYSFLFNYLPPFRIGRYPAKFLVTTPICFSLLAALGVDQLSQLRSRLKEPGGKRQLVLLVILIGSLMIGSAVLSMQWPWQLAGFRVADKVIKLTHQGEAVNLSRTSLHNSILYLWLVLAAGLLLVFYASTRRRGVISWAPLLAISLVFLDLLSNQSVNPLASSEVYSVSPVAEWLTSNTSTGQMCRVYHLTDRESPYRVFGKTDSFAWSFLFRRLSAAPYTAVDQHVQYSTFMPIDRLETFASQLIDAQLRKTQDLGQRLDLLARLNTGYILSMNPVRTPLLELRAGFDLNADRLLHIYWLKTAFPRAYLAELQDRDSGDNSFSPSTDPAQKVEIRRYRESEIDLSATAVKPSMLVLLDSFYPGWQVWVDGREEKIQRVNQAFRGVIVQSGKHQVTFRYEPKSFRYGLALTSSTIAAWAVAFAFVHFRRRRETKAQPVAASENQGAVS